jgi:ABC-type multidrug transport system fused ATPase/permease subunit
VNRYCVGPTMAVDWGEQGPPPAVRRQMMWRVLSYFGPHRRAGLVVVGCIAAQAVLGLAPAVVFKALIDTLARPHPAFSRVGLLVAAGIGAALVGGLVGVAQSYLSTLISQGIVATLRGQLFEALLEQPVGFFTGHKAGDLLSRINTDIDGIEDVVTDTVFGLVSNILVTATTLVLMVTFSWPLTLAVLALIPLVGLPTRKAGRATYAARGRTQRQRGTMSAYLQEILGISGIMLVKAFGTAPAERQRFGAMNRELRALEVRQNLIAQWFRMLMSTLQTAGPALMILFGGWLVVTGRASVGTVFVFATVLGARLAGAVTSLAGMQVNNLPHYPAEATITGIELSPAMLAVARQRAADLGRDVDLREGDAEHLPFDDASFDTVVCALSLCTIPDPGAAIREMRRVLTPGGRLLLLDHIRSTWPPIHAAQWLLERFTIRAAGEHFTRRQLPLLTTAGFEIVEVERLKAGTIERVLARKPATEEGTG